jgi:hypothetical protein
MAQAVSRWPLTAEARIRARVSQWEICGGLSGIVIGSSPSSSVFPCQYHSTVTLHIHISCGGWTVSPLVAAFRRHRITPPTWTTQTSSNIYQVFLTSCSSSLNQLQRVPVCGSSVVAYWTLVRTMWGSSPVQVFFFCFLLNIILHYIKISRPKLCISWKSKQQLYITPL